MKYKFEPIFFPFIFSKLEFVQMEQKMGCRIFTLLLFYYLLLQLDWTFHLFLTLFPVFFLLSIFVHLFFICFEFNLVYFFVVLVVLVCLISITFYCFFFSLIHLIFLLLFVVVVVVVVVECRLPRKGNEPLYLYLEV